MIYPFGATFRRLVARRLATFTRTPALDTEGLKRAAVAVTLLESDDGSGETAFVLTRRGRDLRTHKGQYALPGGRCDEGESAVAAALREVEEELGLRLSGDDVLGMLDDYPTRSGYLITPVVIWAEQTRPLLPNPRRSPRWGARRVLFSLAAPPRHVRRSLLPSKPCSPRRLI